MAKVKVIRDTIHGYIDIDPLFSNIIDTVEFQRLKWIEQGSFRILYPSARHDRFIHSLGVYSLAKKFYSKFVDNIKEDLDDNLISEMENDTLEILKNTFLYGALLHDIGHAPFSHTCEGYFERFDEMGESIIQNNLLEAIKEIPNINIDTFDDFCRDFKSKSYNHPSEHEIISATILVKNAAKFLGSNFNKINLELAARMVIGCTYDYEGTHNNDYIGICNCLIRLINSTTVDVDKLDYITRDTEMSGFDNVPIDIHRLINSVTAIKKAGCIYPAFRKNALSVIDNVFKAKTEQGTWMVSHPIVSYDSELLKICIQEYDKKHNGYIEAIFSIEALQEIGVSFGDRNYRLLSDMDVICDIKSLYSENECIREFFERGERRHPIWKSYYEFKYLLGLVNEGETSFETFETSVAFFKPLIDFMKTEKIFVLNKESFKGLDKQNEKVYTAAKFLHDFSICNNIDLNFTVIETKNSFSAKFDPQKVYIFFRESSHQDSFTTYAELKKDTVDTNQNSDRIAFFYLYSKERFTNNQVEEFFGKLKMQLQKQKNNFTKDRA